jgi:lichenan operon transcriptional antiterminator
MLINQRVKIIISELDKTNEILTGEYFSKLLAVTTRTIRNDIKVFNDAFGQTDHIIQSVKGSGYILNEKYRKDIQSIVKLHPDYIKPIEPLDRIDKICEMLFSNNTLVDIQTLEQTLYVSESTILRDITHVRNYFKPFHVKVKVNESILLEGNETYIREAMLAYILEKDFNDDYFNTIKNNINEILVQMLYKYHIYVSEKQLELLMIKISIIIYRKSNETDVDQKGNSHQSNMAFIEDTMILINQKYLLNYQENQALINLIQLNLCDEYSSKQINMEVIKQALDVTSQTFDVTFSKNLYQSFEKGLIHTHLDIEDRDQFSQIKLEYPLAFEIAMYFSDYLSDKLHIKLSKISILRIIFVFLKDLEKQNNEVVSQKQKIVIVSHLDQFQNQYLKQKIMFSFPLFEIINILPAYFKREDISMETDLILSTKSITYIDKTVIVINPFLKAYDVLKIKTHMKDHYYHRVARFDLMNHFRESLFFKIKDGKSQFEIIEYLVKPLITKYGASKNLFESMMKRESVSSTYIGNFVAIPHAIDKNQGENLIAIAILDKPIDWFDQKVQVIFLIDIKNPKEQHIEHMFNQLYQVIQDDKLIHKLTKAQNYYEFIKVMNERRTT